MAKKQPGTDLQIEEDMDFQRKEWRAERVGWVLMAAIILLALLGFFGGYGPLTQATAGEANSTLWLDYERFNRFRAPSNLTVYVNTEVNESGEIQFWIDREYLSKFQVESISPQPDRVEIEQDRLTYTFIAAQADLPIQVEFELTTDSIGLFGGRAGWMDEATVEMQHFVYP